MIFAFLAMMFLFLWWLSDKHLKDKFNPYLKYSSLFVIIVIFFVELYMFIETERFLKAKEIGGDLGISYSYFNNATNLTVETTMYAKQDIDSGTIMAYHWTEYEAMPIITGMLQYLLMFVGFTLLIQYLWMVYYYNTYGKKEDDTL
jgi:hypothetical protein